MDKKILYVDMDNVLVDFQGAFAQIDPKTLEEYEGQEDNIPGLFGLMPPLEHAIESYEKLAGWFETYILSTAPWENPSAWQDKLLWVKKHLGKPAYKRLIITHNKHLNTGDFLVDDRDANGAKLFPGEWIHFGSEEFPNWPSITEYLKARR